MQTRYIAALALWLATSCASASSPTSSFVAAEDRLASTDEAPPPTGSPLDEYVAYALRHRPELRASLERWRAAQAEVAAVDEMPPIEVMYGYYLSRVETRVGPQRHRVRVQQGIPWPAKAQRRQQARQQNAAVDGVRHDAELVDVRWQVIDAYWQMWAVEQHHQWHAQHLEIVRSLADSVRGRVEVGNATLADVSQAELLVSRTTDAAEQAEQLHHRIALQLARAIGVPPEDVRRIVTAAPRLRLPVASDDEIVAAAMDHPDVRLWAAKREAVRAEISSARAARYPDFGVGAEWMETGPALDPSMPDSGKDAVVGTVGLSIPIWAGEVAGSERVLAAKSASYEASEEAARRDLETTVRQALSDLRETTRRVQLYESTLVPQAEAALGSVRGAYEVGRGAIAALLLAQNDLLELRLQLAALNAAHERQWALLERLVARPVQAQEIQ